MTRKLWICAVLALVLTLTLTAADKPNFSGSWKLNAAKSDFGPMPPPDKYDAVVEHAEPSIKIKTTTANQMGERTNETAFKTDGVETTVGEGPRAMKATVSWEGNALVFKTTRKVNMQGEEVEIKATEKWTLAEDGKSVTVDATLTAPMGEFQMKRVMDKQ